MNNMRQWFNRIVKISIILCISICLFACAGVALAEAVSEASGTISITQLDTATKQPVAGVRLTLYRLAEFSEEPAAHFTWIQAFENLAVDVDSLGETQVAEQTVLALETYIDEKGIAGGQTLTTDANGRVDFTGLADGLYLIRQTNTAEEFAVLGYTYETVSYLVALPRTAEDGKWTRTVNCQPKGTLTALKNETVDVTVYKIWKDSSDKYQARPSSIRVGLYNGETLTEEVTLSVLNNWSHTWEGLDAEGSWSAAELAVPDGYTSTVSREGTAFTITNTYTVETETESEAGTETDTEYETDSEDESETESETNTETESDQPKSGTTSGTSKTGSGAGSSGSSSSSSSSSQPKTGDDTNLLLYLLGLTAGGVMILVILRRRWLYRQEG